MIAEASADSEQLFCDFTEDHDGCSSSVSFKFLFLFPASFWHLAQSIEMSLIQNWQIEIRCFDYCRRALERSPRCPIRVSTSSQDPQTNQNFETRIKSVASMTSQAKKEAKIIPHTIWRFDVDAMYNYRDKASIIIIPFPSL